jgi:molybdopterin synthase catalytic subunit
MKVKPIVGYSKSGKTTFIRKLIVALKSYGEVGVIKHLGKHPYKLDQDKDTTAFYNEGAVVSAGVDDVKTVLTIGNSNLEYLLAIFSDAGIQYAIIEGFKSIHFPKIVMGNLDIDECVLRNPQVEEVLKSIDKFGDYYTMNGLVTELKQECDMSRVGAILTFTGIVREWTGNKRTESSRWLIA